MPSIVVNDDSDTELYYIDTGVPPGLPPAQAYLTIIAVHGMTFTAHVFEPLMSVASNAGVRFVSLNRRDYPRSTPLTPDDNRILSSGTDKEKGTFLRARGVELGRFIDRFIHQQNLPAPPNGAQGIAGGVALLGWSLGATFIFSALANVDALPSQSQARLSQHLRALIMYEPPTVALGSPRPPQLWSPLIDTNLPEKERVPALLPWLTVYFNHGDLSTRDTDVLSYYVPGLSRVPTIYNMSEQERARVVWTESSDKSEMLFMFFFEPQINATYKRACYDRSVRDKFPLLKMWNIMAEHSSPHGIPSFWTMEQDNKEHGGGFVDFKVVSGGNHLMQWDEPDILFKACIERF